MLYILFQKWELPQVNLVSPATSAMPGDHLSGFADNKQIKLSLSPDLSEQTHYNLQIWGFYTHMSSISIFTRLTFWSNHSNNFQTDSVSESGALFPHNPILPSILQVAILSRHGRHCHWSGTIGGGLLISTTSSVEELIRSGG